MLTYTGVGSRETPADICALMTKIADWLRRRGYRLRSGGADGADVAFERGADGAADIFLPWTGFKGRSTGIVLEGNQLRFAQAIAGLCHPAWSRCDEKARLLHTRNVPQVLGADLMSPSEFVVCWTRDGGPTGGTGQAIRIAGHWGVPVFNLFDETAAQRLHDFVVSRV